MTSPARPLTYAPHHHYCLAVADHVATLRVRDKRSIYVCMRKTPDVTPDSFLAHFGLSVSDFVTWQILNDKPRRAVM